MALLDDIMLFLRDHAGYTGDGQGGNGPLPTGDRSTARHLPDMRDLRDLLTRIAQSMGDPSALQTIITDLAGKADLANSGKTFPTRAAAVSAGQAALPAALGQIETREDNYLVLRSPSAFADDPLFDEAPRWGVVLRVPNDAMLEAKADLTNSGKLIGSRAGAVGLGQSALPAALGRIVTREGDYLVWRDPASKADDPLFDTAPQWGVVLRIPSSKLLADEAQSRESRTKSVFEAGGPVALISSGTGVNDIQAVLPPTAQNVGVTLQEDMQVMFRAPATNTGPCTLMGVPLLDNDGAALVASDLLSGRRYYARYSLSDGAHFRLVGGTVQRRDVLAENKLLKTALGSLAEISGSYTPLIAMLDKVGLWLDFTDPANLWQSPAKSVPVVRGQHYIGYVEDKSGNGFDYKADANINRPQFIVENGRGFARFAPGTNSATAQFLRGVRSDLTKDQDCISVFALVRYRGVTGNRSVSTHSTGGNAAVSRIALQVTGGRPNGQARLDDATSRQVWSYAATGWNRTEDEWIILELQADTVDGLLSLFTNGRITADGTVSLDIGDPFNSSQEAGTFISSPSNRLDGDIAAIVEMRGQLSLAERRGVHRYLAGLVGDVSLGDLQRYDPSGPMNAVFFWFNAPNVVRASGNDYLVGGVDASGNILASVFGFDNNGALTGMSNHVLHTRLEIDDHNIPSFATLADGNVIAVYSKHNGDGATWLTKTVTPGDYSQWTAPVDIGPQIHTTPGHSYLVSYNFLFRHSGEGGRLYYVHREGDRTAAGSSSILTQEYWVISWSDDNGATWTRGRKLWGPQRPYTRVWSNGVDRLDFFFNDSHPEADTTNRVHHCYLKGGNFYKSDGTLIGTMDSVLPLNLNADPTLVFDADLAGVGNAWVWDLTYDRATGNPIGTFVVFEPGYVRNDYYQARWTGSAWSVKKITDAGPSLTPALISYAGGVVTDPENPNRVFASVMLDTNGALTEDRNIGTYQICRFDTVNGGNTWTRTWLTRGDKAAFRPVLAPGSRKLFYVTGDYGPHYTEYFTEVRWLDVS